MTEAVVRLVGAGGRSPDTMEAFSDVYAEHYDRLIRLAMVTTGSSATAEDIVQDAFAELYRNWSHVVEPGAWLRRVVVNRGTSWLRRRLVARRHADRARVAEAHQPPSADDVAVRAALGRLQPRQRAALFLRFYLDLPEAEIAAALDCRPSTVRSLVHRGLAVLKEQLDER